MQTGYTSKQFTDAAPRTSWPAGILPPDVLAQAHPGRSSSPVSRPYGSWCSTAAEAVRSGIEHEVDADP